MLSAQYLQESGMLQPSVLSVILFAITISGVINAAWPSVATLLYVNDIITIYYIS
jgi:hypothetical protein